MLFFFWLGVGDRVAGGSLIVFLLYLNSSDYLLNILQFVYFFFICFGRIRTCMASFSWWASSLDSWTCCNLDIYQQHNCSRHIFIFRWKGNFLNLWNITRLIMLMHIFALVGSCILYDYILLVILKLYSSQHFICTLTKLKFSSEQFSVYIRLTFS